MIGGGFRLAASHVTDNIRVLDQGDGTNRIVLWVSGVVISIL